MHKSLSIPLPQALAEWGLIGGDSGYYNKKRDISIHYFEISLNYKQIHILFHVFGTHNTLIQHIIFTFCHALLWHTDSLVGK